MLQQREYFYDVDAKGVLYHQGTPLTDRAFLNFFFRRIAVNQTGRHTRYPWVSPCGREMNYVRCAESIVVFLRMEDGRLFYNHTDLSVAFEPDLLRISSDGMLYHPLNDAIAGRLGERITRELAENISQDGQNYVLTHGSKRYLLPIDS